MIRNGEFFMIKQMQQKGMTISQIAKELGRDRKTIRKWLNEEEPSKYQRVQAKPSKLEPYKGYIFERMQEGCQNAVVLFDEIKSQGYTGSLTLLRYWIRPLRKSTGQRPVQRFETPPGNQAQVDWGQFTVNWGGKKKRIYAFVMVLGYSRMMYLEFTENERLETLMGCHVRAMEYFGGRTETCLYDNMKTVVTGLDESGHIVWNERFAGFATHHGFTLKRCAPYRAQTKGKVENGIGYVRKNFWPRVRTFTNLENLNQQARSWIDTIANVRCHGTTFERPVDRLPKEGLKPFNPIPYGMAERFQRKVSVEALVAYQLNRYSVPYQYAGQVVEIQDNQNGTITIYSGLHIIAEHPKATGQHQVVVNPKHFEGIRASSKQPVHSTLPKLQAQAPEVVVRSLAIYDLLAEEVIS